MLILVGVTAALMLMAFGLQKLLKPRVGKKSKSSAPATRKSPAPHTPGDEGMARVSAEHGVEARQA